MSSDAKQVPTEQQDSRPGEPKRFAPGQTVCNEKNEKGKLCNGHLKEVNTQHPSRVFLRGDDTLHRCQACGALYMGPPMGHVRDPRKQARYVERDLAAILQAAGGTLPAYEYPTPAWRGAPRPKAVKPAAPAKPAAAKAPAAKAPAADSSAAADAHRPAAEAQAATGQASAAPLSPTAATASPAAGAETVSDLAPQASTELTPGAPKDERPKSEASAAAPAPAAGDKPKPKKGAGGFKVPPELQPKPGETFEEKVARLKATAEAAKRASGKL
jgi:Tfp pilus assembly protein FimV